MSKKQYVLEPEYRAVADKYGIEFVGPLPMNTREKTTWRCSAGHEWQAAYGNVARGAGAYCRICTTPKWYRLSNADYARRGKQLGFEYLGPLPVYTTEKTNWRCSHGHIWAACLHYITGCPECVKIQPLQYHEMANANGFLWLGPYPKDIETLTNWECNKGHIFSDRYANIRDWPNCPTCTFENKVSLQDYLLLSDQKGIELIGKVPQRSNFHTEWRCENGHIFKTSYQTLMAGKKGNGCIHCRNANRTGASNPNWTGGPQNDNAYRMSFVKKIIRRRDNFCCQICSKRKIKNGHSLDVHHIIPRRFSESNLHFDPENLITLCAKHHKQAEHHLLQSIPIFRNILSRKYQYDYPYMDADLEYMYEQLLQYPHSQGNFALDWLLEYPEALLGG